MSGQITIRKYEESDQEAINYIESQTKRELTPILSILCYYDIPSDGFLVAEMEGNVVGFIVLTTRTTAAENMEGRILSIATDLAYKRRGIGKALINHTINMMREKGVRRIRLEVKTNNTNAQRFYYKIGFQKSHIIPHYYRMRGFTEDALSLVKYF